MNLPKVHEYRTVPLQYQDESGNVLYSRLCPLVVWHVGPGEKVSKAIMAASDLYAQETGQQAVIALINQIPEGAEDLIEVHGVTLVRQDWVEPGFVLVGRADNWVVEVEWQNQLV